MKKNSLFFAWEYVTPIVLLVYLLLNTTYYFFFKPYVGLEVDSKGNVTYLAPSLADTAVIKPGDAIIQIDGEPYANFTNNLDAPPLWQGYHPGDKVPVTVKRDGAVLEKYHILPTDLLPIFTTRLLSQWFMSYLFYIAGLMALLFLRPRNIQRNLFMLFNFVIAIWFSASSLSGTHDLNAQFVLRAAFWIWLPVALHFHWIFPRPLKTLPAWVAPLLYAICIFIAVAQVARWVSPDAYLISFLLAVLGSIGLLVAHIFLQPDFRRLIGQTRNLFIFLLIPIGAAAILYFVSIESGDYFLPLALLGISALPGFYLFILNFQNNLMSGPRVRRLYRLYTWITLAGILLGVAFAITKSFFADASAIFSNYFILILIGLMFVNFTPLLVLPTLSNSSLLKNEDTLLKNEDTLLQIRANRLSAGVIFVFCMLVLGSVLGIALIMLSSEHFDYFVPPLVALVVSAATMFWLSPFQRWFEQNILNVPIRPEKLLDTYSESILTSLNKPTLSNLFLQQVLPTLLVRQFALLEKDSSQLRAVITLGVDLEQLPQTIQAQTNWARLTFPLSLNGEVAGLMLFGRRDPDDYYAPNEIAVLQQVANLTALTLANIRQSDSLFELYRTDMERRESERTTLAAELHDDVLQRMAVLSNQLSDMQTTPELLDTYQGIADRIREITRGLRSPMLAFGLVDALEGLVDSAQERGLKGCTVTFDVTGETHPGGHVEIHLYRLAQQALDNALQHSKASEIRLSGTLSETVVNLEIRDNGIGFAADKNLEISSLLVNKHFGIAGMFERAALIGAEISIQSQPGKGCCFRIHWAKNDKQTSLGADQSTGSEPKSLADLTG